jgi:hypothetical protein
MDRKSHEKVSFPKMKNRGRTQQYFAREEKILEKLFQTCPIITPIPPQQKVGWNKRAEGFIPSLHFSSG